MQKLTVWALVPRRGPLTQSYLEAMDYADQLVYDYSRYNPDNHDHDPGVIHFDTASAIAQRPALNAIAELKAGELPDLFISPHDDQTGPARWPDQNRQELSDRIRHLLNDAPGKPNHTVVTMIWQI